MIRASAPARELALCLAANRWGARSRSRAFFAGVSRLGDGPVWYVLILGLPLVDGWRGLQAAAHLAATALVVLIVYMTLKRWTHRPRPCATHREIVALVAPLDEFSFPSGHTLQAVSLAVVASAHYPVLALPLAAFAACIAVSRVVLGLHYPSDVLAAIAIGTGLASLSLYLVPGVALI